MSGCGVDAATYANGAVLRPCDQELVVGTYGDAACMVGLVGFLITGKREATRVVTR